MKRKLHQSLVQVQFFSLYLDHNVRREASRGIYFLEISTQKRHDRLIKATKRIFELSDIE